MLAAVLSLVLLPASAHRFTTTEVLVLLKADGTWQVDMTVDVDALALGVSQEEPSSEVVAQLEAMSAAEFETSLERARETLLRRVRVRFDGEKLTPEVTFPDMGSPLADRWGEPTVLGATARLAGLIPPGAAQMTFGASRAFDAVHVTFLDQASLTGERHLLQPGEDSPAFALDRAAATRAERPSVIADYIAVGFEHILPRGLDHILIVLGLFLLSARPRPLLLQITAFTLAHTVTLALSMYGVVSLPSRLVEALIALSIAYVAVENLLTSELTPWRPILVFAFGLLHGLGFAGALREWGLPREEFVTALVSFNVGVELGQLGVVGLAFLTVGWFRDREWYRPAIVWPLSALIALVGLWWAFERAVFGV
jgi:hypothetical protein